MAYPRACSAAALAGLLLLSACAQRGTATPAPEPSPAPSVELPADGAALVLRVEYVGGFVTPAMLAGRLPLYSLYADGRLITDGPVEAIYPGPALPNVQVQQLDAATVQALADRALVSGVGETADLGSPPIADLPSTRFTLTTAGGTVVREVYGLTEHLVEGDGAEAGLTDAQIADRARLRDLMTALFDLGQQEPPVSAYVPEAVAALAMPWLDPQDELAHPELAWPGPELPGQAVVGPLDIGCVVADGEQASAVLAAASAANAATPWVAGGTRWSVTLRPLLPDESGCADLGD